MGKTIGLALMAAAWIIGMSGTALAASKRIIIVASYEQNHICGWPQEQGILKGLAKEGWFEGLNLEVRRFYMDTKRTNTSLNAMKEVAGLALKSIDRYKPQLVVTLDDNAFREVGLKLVNHPDTSVVFSGMNGQPETYNKVIPYMKNRKNPAGNTTGVYEKLYVSRSLRVMEQAVQGLTGGVIIGITDYSPTGNAIAEQFKAELAENPGDISWRLVRVKDWNDYVSLIHRLNTDKSVKAIYPVALTLKASSDRTFTAPEIFKWTVENSTKPEMALNYFFAKIGLFGGAAVDFQKMRFMAGKKAGKILNGKPAGSLPIEDAPDYAIVFNKKRAEQLGIEIPVPLLTAADHVYAD